MKACLLSLVQELQRLKGEGLRHVSVAETSLEALRHALASQVPAPEKAAPREPPPEPKSPLQVAERPPLAPSPAFSLPQVEVAKPTPQQVPAPSPLILPEGDKTSRWQWLKNRLLSEALCRAQVKPGRQAVFGVGSLEASLFFVSEAPGAEEELQGEPFVGPAGQLLTKMITAMGLQRDQVYLAYLLNWRPELPPGLEGGPQANREPTEAEISYCLPYLRAQIEVVQPKVLVALGAPAARALLGAGHFKSLGEARGRWHNYGDKLLRVTYNPSYLLRKETESKAAAKKAKRAVWEDLMEVMERTGLPLSEKQRAFFT